jgi:hypothetical protein
MKHTVQLTDRQVEIIRDLLQDTLHDLEEDISHFETHPEELNAESEEGEEPITIEDYEGYRDEVQTLMGLMPEVETES